MHRRRAPALGRAPLLALSVALALAMPGSARAAALAQEVEPQLGGPVMPDPDRVCTKSGEKCAGYPGFNHIERVFCCDEELVCGVPVTVPDGLWGQFCVPIEQIDIPKSNGANGGVWYGGRPDPSDGDSPENEDDSPENEGDSPENEGDSPENAGSSAGNDSDSAENEDDGPGNKNETAENEGDSVEKEDDRQGVPKEGGPAKWEKWGGIFGGVSVLLGLIFGVITVYYMRRPRPPVTN